MIQQVDFMPTDARESILSRLRAAPKRDFPARPVLPWPATAPADRTQLIASFRQSLQEVGGVLFEVDDRASLYRKLEEILREEGVRRAIATTDEVIGPLDLPAWGRGIGVEIRTPPDFKDRDSFKNAVFREVDAGITGVDFAVAATGTLVLIHDRSQTRLVSLAPVLHVAILPMERVVAEYDQVIGQVFGAGGRPSQVCLVTGPSSTADIQATPFKGMHGPRRLLVLLLGKP